MTNEKRALAVIACIILGLAILGYAATTEAATCIEGGNVTLTWTPNPEPDVAGYELHRSVSGVDGLYEKISGETLIPETTYVDSALPDGEYTPYYKLIAVDECGNRSAMSVASEGTVRHDTVAPSAPGAPAESVTP